MTSAVFAKTVRDYRWSVVGWSIGLVALAVLTIAFYPALKDQPDIDKAMEQAPEAVLALFGIEPGMSLTSPEGYLDSQLFAMMVPLLLLIFAVGFGSGAIAGEEERGTLDLLLAQPVARRRVVVDKFLALVGLLALLSAVLLLSTAAPAPLAGLNIGFDELAAAVLANFLTALFFGSLALAAGAAAGRRGLSIAIGAAIASATFTVDGLSSAVETIRPLRYLSPWYYASEGQPLLEGFSLLGPVVLLSLTAVALAVSLWAFDRRDLGRA